MIVYKDKAFFFVKENVRSFKGLKWSQVQNCAFTYKFNVLTAATPEIGNGLQVVINLCGSCVKNKLNFISVSL